MMQILSSILALAFPKSSSSLGDNPLKLMLIRYGGANNMQSDFFFVFLPPQSVELFPPGLAK